jgi:hypothetical protein
MPSDAGLPAIVKVIEPTGADTQLLCGVAGHDVTVSGLSWSSPSVVESGSVVPRQATRSPPWVCIKQVVALRCEVQRVADAQIAPLAQQEYR